MANGEGRASPTSPARCGRIAHVITESAPFGGAQRNTLLSVKGLVRDGYDVELVCGPGGPLIDEARAIGAPVHVVPELVRTIDPRRDLAALRRLIGLFRSREYQIVHTHSTKAGLIGRLAAWWVGSPLIVHTQHSVLGELTRSPRTLVFLAVERAASIITHRIVCVGDAFRQELEAWHMAPAKKLVTIYSGIEFSTLAAKRTPGETRRDVGLEDAWPVVGSVGRLMPQKAHEYLLESVAMLRSKYPRIRLLLVGDGECRDSLEARAKELDVSSGVLFLGERGDVADLLRVFDVYAMSSIFEGVGRALSEAMYCELPIVATPVNGVKEMVLHEETGLVVPPRDARSLAAAIDRVVSDPELGKRLGTNARRRAAELLDGERMIRGIEDLYGALTAGAWSPA